MKTTSIFSIIATVSLLTVFSCAKEMETEITPIKTSEETSPAKTYTITVVADKGEAGTKALELNGKTLTASWKQGEKVSVHNKTKNIDLEGELVAQESGESTTLKGTLTGTIENGDKLLLKFCSPSYTAQEGTLDYIAANCDYATAEVDVTLPDGSSTITVTDAKFKSQQAIVKFILKENDELGSSIEGGVKSLIVKSSGTDVIAVTPTSATNELFVAIPAINGAPISLQATAADDTYRGYYKTAVTFAVNKYYEIGVKMSKVIPVSNDTELRQAISDYNNVIVMLTADILMDDKTDGTNCLLIDGNKNVTIDLNGHELSRGLTGAPSDNIGGHVIGVRDGSSVTINDSSFDNSGSITGGWSGKGGGIYINGGGSVIINGGTISGNHATEQGGGIYNAGTLTINGGVISGNEAKGNGSGGNGGGIYNDGGSVTFKDGSITGNSCDEDGGGIVNKGTFTMSGGSITDNTAGDEGGGICSVTPLTLTGGTISGNTAAESGRGDGIDCRAGITIQGNPNVSGNTHEDIFLATGQVITVTGPLTGGENSIGMKLQKPGIFTSGYGESGTQTNPFFPSGTKAIIKFTETEVRLTSSYYYISCSWDGKEVVQTKEYLLDDPILISPENAASLVDNNGNIGLSGWYAVEGQITVSPEVYCGLDAKLILCDGATLTLENGLRVERSGDNKLTIYCQSYGDAMGKLIVTTKDDGDAGIGGRAWLSAGTITIHGGHIEAQGKDNAAGIGGGKYGNGPTLTVYGGNVQGNGGKHGAGIGGGLGIYYDSSSSSSGNGGVVTIYGGTVIGVGGNDGAGIGSGSADSDNPGDPDLHGGELLVYGGYVEAHGKNMGAGIGGGKDADGAHVFIHGGTVKAYAGEDSFAFGSNLKAGHQGWLNFDDGLRVNLSMTDFLPSYVLAGDRVSSCWGHQYACAEPCDQHEYVNGICKWCKHPEN